MVRLPERRVEPETVIAHLEKKLGVCEGQVTKDGRFSFIRMECIGRCDGAAAMLVDDDYQVRLAVQLNPDGSQTLWAPAGAEWREWAAIPAADTLTTQPVGFDRHFEQGL